MIVSDGEYYQLELLKRLEDCVFRKSETEVIDLQSAASMLESAQLAERFDFECVMRIAEMLTLRLEHERGIVNPVFFTQPAIRNFRLLNSCQGSSLDNASTHKLYQGLFQTLKMQAVALSDDEKFELRLIFEDNLMMQKEEYDALLAV